MTFLLIIILLLLVFIVIGIFWFACKLSSIHSRMEEQKELEHLIKEIENGRHRKDSDGKTS